VARGDHSSANSVGSSLRPHRWHHVASGGRPCAGVSGFVDGSGPTASFAVRGCGKAGTEKEREKASIRWLAHTVRQLSFEAPQGRPAIPARLAPPPGMREEARLSNMRATARCWGIGNEGDRGPRSPGAAAGIGEGIGNWDRGQARDRGLRIRIHGATAVPPAPGTPGRGAGPACAARPRATPRRTATCLIPRAATARRTEPARSRVSRKIARRSGPRSITWCRTPGLDRHRRSLPAGSVAGRKTSGRRPGDYVGTSMDLSWDAARGEKVAGIVGEPGCRQLRQVPPVRPLGQSRGSLHDYPS
jgi:hypothetical protein